MTSRPERVVEGWREAAPVSQGGAILREVVLDAGRHEEARGGTRRHEAGRGCARRRGTERRHGEGRRSGAPLRPRGGSEWREAMGLVAWGSST